MRYAAGELPRRRFCMPGSGVALVIVLEDELLGDARWSWLAEQFPEPRPRLSEAQHAAREDTLQAAYVRMYLAVGHQRDDGYIGHREALKMCRGKQWVLDALTTPTRGKGPLVHRQGESCGRKNCIDASPPWVEGFEYRICAFLKKNASRKEKERHETQRKELDDSALRAFVYDRDGGCCRYCRSGPMKRKGMGNAKDLRRIPQMEHVDPDKPAGPDRSGVVLGCKRCNTEKGRRTPDEAEMELLPPPTAAQIAYWQARGEQQFDYLSKPGEHPADTVPDEWPDNPTDNPSDNVIDNAQTTRSPIVDQVTETVVPGTVHDTTGVPAGDLVPAGQAQGNPHDTDRPVSGPGRVGLPPPVPVLGPLDQPVRDSSDPDIWTRRSRAPAAAPAGGDPHGP